MRLARVDVRVLPGLEGRFSLEPAPGVNLVVGPNTSGKSSLVRAVGSLLWPAPGGAGQDFLAVTFACRDGLRVAERRADGALVWTRDGRPTPPPRLPDDHLRDRYALGLADLADARGAVSERAFAAEIRRQMTGGFDLDATGTDLLRVSAAQVRARLRDWRQARLARGEHERAHRELRERERALETWRADLAAAEARVREAEALKAALAVHDARNAAAATAERLAGFPAALAAFRPEDPATLETWRQALAGAETDVAQHARRLQEAHERLRALGPVPPPEAGYPAAVDTLVEAWRQAAVALDTAAATLDGIRSQRQDAIDRLHGAPADATAAVNGRGGPDREALERLARLFVAAEEARARVSAAESLLAERVFADADGPSAPGPAQLDDTAAAVAALEAWLAQPSPSPWWPLAAGVAGLVLLGSAVVAGRESVAALPALVGGLLLVAGVAGAARAAAARRERGRRTGLARSRLAAAGLADAERAVADADAGAAAAARDRLRLAAARQELVGSWRDRLRAERDRALARLRELDAEAADLRRSSGVGRELDGRGVLHDLDAAARLRDTEGALARALAEHAKRAENERERAARAREALRATGEPAPSDPIAAAAAVRRWQARLEERAALELGAARASEDLDAAARRRDEAAAETARLRERLGLTADDDDAQVALLAARHAAWSEAAAAHDAARAALAAREADADAALTGLPGAELRERLEAAGDAPAVVRDLLQRIAKLEGDLERARGSRGLEEALAAEERARDRLADERATARRAALADRLLADLRREEAATTRPAVLEHAAQLLRAFTQGRHRLELASGTDGFVAVDQASGLPQPLAELSDGTRVQLLLAVRLAFITAMEDDETLPLFLDEALTTTDPDRFAAMAAALGELARAQGRQVFYLTSQPGDVGAWNAALAARGLPAARVIDLAAARRLAGAATVEQLAPPAPAPVPEPGDGPDALQRWRLAVGVPPLAPRRGAAAQHIDWLLLDDARLERRLLVAGAAQVGPLLASLEDLVDFGTLDHATADRLRARAAALEAFVAAWQVGRGRAVTAADVDASGVVSEVMRAPLLGLLERLDGDARALAARWREVPRLQQKIAENLLDHLRAIGALDERDVLGERDVLARVLGELGRRGGGGAVGEAEVAGWVARWWRAAAG